MGFANDDECGDAGYVRYRNRDRIHPFPQAEHGLSLPTQDTT